MAAASGNESNGLKAAVAIFGAMTLLLMVACYFLYSSYDDVSKQLQKAKGEATTSQKGQMAATDSFNVARKLAGFPGDSFRSGAEIKTAFNNHRAATQTKIEESGKSINQALAGADAAAKAANLTILPPELEKLRQEHNNLQTQLRNDADLSNQTNRLSAIVVNEGAIIAQLSRDNVGLRRQLAAIDALNKAQVQVAVKTRDDKAGENTKLQADGDEALRTLRDEQSRLQAENTVLVADLEKKKDELTDKEKRYKSQVADLQSINDEYNNQLSKQDAVLDKPDGRLTEVNLRTREVKVGVTRKMGARPQMVMTIFDKNAQGLPSDRPKGKIMITETGDKSSKARILEVVDDTKPFVANDIVYSSAWDAENPTRFALVGKIDLNRDGVDDRNDVKRLIEGAGGVVVYDLPPKDVGPETGKLSPRIRWLVIDERNSSTDERQKQVQDEAKVNGIPPLPLSRLSSQLGLSYDLSNQTKTDSNSK